MNIFLPYENNVFKSVMSLDDRRLNKQILECTQILNAIEKIKSGEKGGYINHPVVQFYKDNSKFVNHYGYACCEVYEFISKKRHKLAGNFNVLTCPKYIPYYMEGSLGQPNYIRTTNNVSALFQEKLTNKWNNDKIKPTWENREIPDFYLR